GSHACEGDSYGTCNAQGSAYSDSVIDCSATKKLCSPTSGCVTSLVDEIGKFPSGVVSASAPSFFGNIISVEVSRKLTEIAVDLVLPQSAQLTWAVYLYDYDGAVFKPVSKTVTTQAAVDGLATSGALGVALSGGQVYAIGVIFKPTATNSGVRIGCQGEP